MYYLRENRRQPKVPSWVGYVGDMKTPQDFLSTKRWLSGWFPIKYANSFFRSFGVVAFANNPLTGLLIFIGICVESGEIALSCAFAAFTAFVTCKMLSVDNRELCRGLPMFNSILVGAISAAVAPTVFNTPLSVALWFGIGVSASLTVFVDQGLNALMAPSTLPAQSVPFNFVVAVFMLIISSYNQSQLLYGLHIEEISTVTEEIHNSTDDIITLINATDHNGINWPKVWNGVLLSSGQIYGVEAFTSSVFIWVAYFLCSPLLTILMACGAIIGSMFGALFVPAVLEEVYRGLWGYNSLLAAGGIMYFNVPSPVCIIAALVNAFIAVCVQIALLPIFSSTTMPVFSYPFNVAIMLVLAISVRKNSPMIFITDLTFPELHLYKCYKNFKSEDNITDIEDDVPLRGHKGIDVQ